MNKKCSKCKEVKDMDGFYERNNGDIYCECKKCGNERYILWYKENKDKIKKYQIKNKDKIKKYYKQYCEDNKEKRKQSWKNYHKKNREKLIIKAKE